MRMNQEVSSRANFAVPYNKNKARPGIKPVQDELKQKLYYEYATGKFYSRGNVVFGKWGKEVGNVCSETGRVVIGFNYLSFPAEKLAWLYVKGYIPDETPLHRDGNLANNAWNNLYLPEKKV